MKVYLTEKQINRILLRVSEGIDYGVNNKTINATVNSRLDDKSNYGFDTRIFGRKDQILNGDGTNGPRVQSFKSRVDKKTAMINTLKSIIDWLQNGKQGEYTIDSNIDKISARSIKERVESLSDDELLYWLQQTLERYNSEYGVIKGKYDRVTNSDDDSIHERYQKGVVPGTDISLIALFDISDFNVSDLMKHGQVRQGPLTDKLLNINNADREKVTKVFGGAAALKKIPVRYDNNIEPNVASNFSLDNSTGDSHLNRKKYDYSDNSYTSVAQFIDKSISYASSVLRIEDVHPDFIVTAPSSSKYNDLYCTRLSQKTGVEYVPDFFKRNMLNVVFDEDGMRNAGFSDETINDTAMKVKSAIMSEMAYMLRKPLERFIKDNWQVFSSVRLRKASRSFMTQSDITTVLLEYAYKELERIVESPGSSINDNISRIILNRTINKSSSYVNLDYVTSTLSALISRYCANEFTSAMRNIAWMIAGFHNKLLGEGLPLNFESRSFKIVSFEKRIRPFIKNAYVIADKELNRDGDLFSRYRQASFLLFDEDMNSGATLKILADAMNDKGVMNNQITCLVNAYSAGGA